MSVVFSGAYSCVSFVSQGLCLRSVLIRKSRVSNSSAAISLRSSFFGGLFPVIMWCLECCIAFRMDCGSYVFGQCRHNHFLSHIVFGIIVVHLYINLSSRGLPSWRGLLLSSLSVPWLVSMFRFDVV